MRTPTVTRRRGARLAAAALAAVALAGCTSQVAGHGRPGPQPPSARAAAYLAMVNLSAAAAVHYKGTFSNGGDTIDVDATVTSSGEATGTLGVGTAKIGLLVLQGVTYIHAPESYWTSGGAKSSGITKRYAANWVRVPAMVFGLDIGTALAPGALARWQRGTVEAASDRPVGQATGETLRVPAQDSFFELTAKQPYRLVRLHSAAVPDLNKVHRFVPPKPGTPVPPAPAASDLEVTVSDVSPTLAQVYGQLTRQAAQLATAIDGEGRITLGQQQFTGCGAAGCTITVAFTNSGTRPIRAGLHADWDGDNKPIGVCDSVSGQVAVRGNATARCTITSAGWRAFYNRAISSPSGLPYGARYSVLPLAGTANNAKLGTDSATARCGTGASRAANCAPAAPASSEARDAAVRAAYAAIRKKYGQSMPYGAVSAVRPVSQATAAVNPADAYPDIVVFFGDRTFVYQIANLSQAAAAKQRVTNLVGSVRKDILPGAPVEAGPDLGRITVQDPKLKRTITLISQKNNPGVIIYTIS